VVWWYENSLNFLVVCKNFVFTGGLFQNKSWAVAYAFFWKLDRVGLRVGFENFFEILVGGWWLALKTWRKLTDLGMVANLDADCADFGISLIFNGSWSLEVVFYNLMVCWIDGEG